MIAVLPVWGSYHPVLRMAPPGLTTTSLHISTSITTEPDLHDVRLVGPAARWSSGEVTRLWCGKDHGSSPGGEKRLRHNERGPRQMLGADKYVHEFVLASHKMHRRKPEDKYMQTGHGVWKHGVRANLHCSFGALQSVDRGGWRGVIQSMAAAEMQRGFHNALVSSCIILLHY